ncbi:MAG: hypothetical protein H7Z42_11210 [Roseiflexaceae bacterium]|nr:hypothetical protein [Roseiflexaceae bacterium]
MAVVIDEVEVQPTTGQRVGEPPQRQEAPPSPSVETAPAAVANTRHTLHHIERRAARLRAH